MMSNVTPVPVTSIATLALHRFPLTTTVAARREAAISTLQGMIGAARSLRAKSISRNVRQKPVN